MGWGRGRKIRRKTEEGDGKGWEKRRMMMSKKEIETEDRCHIEEIESEKEMGGGRERKPFSHYISQQRDNVKK